MLDTGQRAALYGAGADAAGHLLSHVFRIPLAKALNPLDRRDFMVITNRIAQRLRSAAAGQEAEAARQVIKTLDVDWPSLTAEARRKVTEAARTAMGRTGGFVAPRVEAVLSPEAARVVADTKDATVERFGLRIASTFTDTDERIAAYCTSSQVLFVRDIYGVRAEGMAQTARDIVSEGLEQGLGREELAERLEMMVGQAVPRDPAYWQVVAGAFMNRARTWTQVNSFSDAGIERYRIEAVLDEATSEICRFLHGREFSVRKGVDKIAEVMALKDPEDIKRAQPWANVRVGEEGGELWFNGEEGATALAHVDEWGEGERDRVGTYSGALDDAQLETEGFGMPPYHGNCRTTVVAVV